MVHILDNCPAIINQFPKMAPQFHNVSLILAFSAFPHNVQEKYEVKELRSQEFFVHLKCDSPTQGFFLFLQRHSPDPRFSFTLFTHIHSASQSLFVCFLFSCLHLLLQLIKDLKDSSLSHSHLQSVIEQKEPLHQPKAGGGGKPVV